MNCRSGNIVAYIIQLSEIIGATYVENPLSYLETLDMTFNQLQLKLKDAKHSEKQKQNELSQIAGRREMLKQQCKFKSHSLTSNSNLFPVHSAENQIAELQRQIASYKITSLPQLEEILSARKLERDRLDHNIR
jgi:hypothetical protein